MIAALWANSNLDDGKGTRSQIIAELETQYSEVVEQVLDRDWERKQALIDKEWDENPFYRKAREGAAKLDEMAGVKSEGTVQSVVAPEELDQS
jgi:hypothetical protein